MGKFFRIPLVSTKILALIHPAGASLLHYNTPLID
jgi:hypothetical protein